MFDRITFDTAIMAGHAYGECGSRYPSSSIWWLME